jgi:hypothetical protein
MYLLGGARGRTLVNVARDAQMPQGAAGRFVKAGLGVPARPSSRGRDSPIALKLSHGRADTIWACDP